MRASRVLPALRGEYARCARGGIFFLVLGFKQFCVFMFAAFPFLVSVQFRSQFRRSNCLKRRRASHYIAPQRDHLTSITAALHRSSSPQLVTAARHRSSSMTSSEKSSKIWSMQGREGFDYGSLGGVGWALGWAVGTQGMTFFRNFFSFISTFDFDFYAS